MFLHTFNLFIPPTFIHLGELWITMHQKLRRLYLTRLLKELCMVLTDGAGADNFASESVTSQVRIKRNV
jgi:hypothetical protein